MNYFIDFLLMVAIPLISVAMLCLVVVGGREIVFSVTRMQNLKRVSMHNQAFEDHHQGVTNRRQFTGSRRKFTERRMQQTDRRQLAYA